MYCKVIAASLVLVIPFLTTLIYWSRSTGLEVAWGKYVQYVQFQPSSNTADTDMKTILIWTASMEGGIHVWGFNWEGNQHTDLSDFGCDQESYKCILTSNRSLLKDESLYDGVMFHDGETNQLDIPDQDKRKKNQVYMFTAFEAPDHANPIASFYFDPVINSNFFNVTMTYSSQAEIHIPLGKIVKVASHPSGEELDLFIRRFGEDNARNVTIKTPDKFFAAIFASNCGSRSRREQLVAELGKLVPVDVFGGCGQPIFGHNGTAEAEDDMLLIIEKYQFYLSFENALCKDYVTERLYDILASDVIPVVLNGANMSRIAPKHSYIDVEDFSTITDLGNYLQKVSSDPALYASYFWWRQHYEVQFVAKRIQRHYVKVFCEACRYLHSGRGPRIVEDLKKEWVDGGECRGHPNISYIDEVDTAA